MTSSGQKVKFPSKLKCACHIIYFYWRILIYNVGLVSGVQQSEPVIHISFFFRLFSHIGHYRVLSSVPCAIQ